MLAPDKERLILFARATTDVMMDLDRSNKIIESTGKRKIDGLRAADLERHQFINLVHSADRLRVERALKQARDGKAVRDLSFRFKPAKNSFNAFANAFVAEEFPDKLFVSLRLVDPRTASAQGESGAGEIDAFFALVADRVKENHKDQIIFIDLIDGTDGDGSGEAESAKSNWDIREYLSGVAVTQNAVAQFTGSRYGVLAPADVSKKLIETGLRNILARTLDQSSIKLGISATPTETKGAKDDKSETEAAKRDVEGRALAFALKEIATAQDAITPEKLQKVLNDGAVKFAKRIQSAKSIITDKRFSLAYQPIVGVSDGTVHHHEALLRFKKADVSPFEFIKFCEGTGLIMDCDRVVTETVAHQIIALQSRGETRSVAINLSARSLNSPAFQTFLERFLQEVPGLRGKILFEITESSKLDNIEATNRFIQAIRRRDFPVCMDDFGAGEAAFTYLKGLEVDYVKIDGSYIKDARVAERDKAFLRAMARLCHDLGVRTIAEHVETDDDVSLVASCEIPLAQGYFFGKLELVSEEIAEDQDAAKKLSATATKANRATGNFGMSIAMQHQVR